MITKSLLLFTIYIKNHLDINCCQQVSDLMKYNGNSDAQMDKLADENNQPAKVDLIAFETLCDYNAASVRVACQLNKNRQYMMNRIVLRN